MSNACQHQHKCVECGKDYTCDHPECMELPGLQGACQPCSWFHGWCRKNDKGDDWSAM